MRSPRTSPQTSRRRRGAVSLDASLRQLGSAHSVLRNREEELVRLRRAAPTDEHPGLLRDLQMLQLKLYGGGSPVPMLKQSYGY